MLDIDEHGGMTTTTYSCTLRWKVTHRWNMKNAYVKERNHRTLELRKFFERNPYLSR